MQDSLESVKGDLRARNRLAGYAGNAYDWGMADKGRDRLLARWVRQLRSARRDYEARHGDIPYWEIGQRVADLLGEPTPFSTQRVSLWFTEQEPKYSIGCALAKVLEADPLALGLPAQSEIDEERKEAQLAEEQARVAESVRKVNAARNAEQRGKRGGKAS